MGFAKRYAKKQKGGAPRTGIDVKGIASFNPASKPGLVFWVHASAPTTLKRTPIGQYAAEQLPLIRVELLDQFSANLSEPVLTEITSTASSPNSLVRLEAVETMSTAFPTLYEPNTGEPPAIDISPGRGTVTLISKEPIDIPDNHTIMVDGENVAAKYNTVLDRILLTASTVGGPVTYTTDANGKTVPTPTAFFRELLVFDRDLSPEERQEIEGYFAYRANTQGLLPPDHPYLPDMVSDPVIAPPIGKLGPVLETLKTAQSRLDTDYKVYAAKVGEGDAVATEYKELSKQLATSLQTVNRLRQLLFKGALLARAKSAGADYTLAEIYTLLNSAGLTQPPLSDAQIDADIKAANDGLRAAKEFLPKLATADQKVAEQTVAMNGEKVVAARQDAETEERLRDVEAQVRRREFVRSQRILRQELDRLGDTLLNPLVEAFQTELQTTREAFEFQQTHRQERLRETETAFEPLRLSFSGQDDLWAQPFKEFLDIGKTEAGEYSHPTLKAIHDVYQSIAAALQAGDVAYLKQQLDRVTKEALARIQEWHPRRSLALFRRLYVAHVRQAFERAERWNDQLTERLERIDAAIKQLTTDLESLRRYKEVTPFRPTFPKDTFLPLPPIYVAKLSAADSALLLGYSHIRVDAAGVPQAEMNATGDLDVEFIFPDNAAIQPGRDSYSVDSGYVDPDTGKPIRQIYSFVSIQAKSILERLPPSRLPPLKSLRLESGTAAPPEASRDLVNTILQVTSEGIPHPLSLPKYAVPDGAFYCVQNVGANPLWVRNPGAVDDILDLVGPGEVGVYMYGEGTSLTSSPGFAYGHQVWQEGRLPYDTILNVPRSSYGVLVKELKTTIYCLPTAPQPTALLDAEGYFVPVRFDTDGNVYDVDDFAQSNPYSIRTLPETGLEGLAFDRKVAKGMVRIGGAGGAAPRKFPVAVDSKTGAAILCSRPGIPAADEFGIGKFVLTPILWTGGAAKCKGSGEDLELEFSGAEAGAAAVVQPFLFPEGLSFQALFRSQFCKPFRLESGSLAPVFTTAQEIPLLSPKGEFIFIPSNSAPAPPHDLFIYAEPAGVMNQIFLQSKDSPITEPGPAPPAHIPFRQMEAVTHNANVERKARLLITRFVSGFEYSRGTPKRLQEAAATIQTLGDTVTESVRAGIADTVGMVEERLKTFTEFEGMIERLNRAMKDGEVPDDVAMSLGVLELRLRDKMMEIMDLVASIQKPVDNYMFLLERREAAKKFVERMRTMGDEVFKRGFAAIQYLYKVHLERTKSISSPEIDATTAQLKATEVDFKAKQTDLEGRLADQPDTVAEIREWLLDLQERAGKQFTELQSAENLVTLELINKMKGAEEEDTAAAKREMETLRQQADELRSAAKRYADLFEMRDRPAEIEIGGSGAGPFVHLKTPSLERDIAPLLGQEAVDAIQRQGADVAVLWGQMNRATIADATGITDAIAVRTSLQSARAAVESMRAALKEIETRMEIPFQVYANRAATVVTEQRKQIADVTQKLRGIVMELDTQRIAIITAVKSLSATLTEEEKSKVATIENSAEATAKKFTAASVPESQNPNDTNPFRIQAELDALKMKEQEGAQVLEEMKQPIQMFQEFRQGLTERLAIVFEEKRDGLKAEYEALKATMPPEAAARLEKEFVPGYQALLAAAPKELLPLLDQIGEVGRLRAILTV